MYDIRDSIVYQSVRNGKTSPLLHYHDCDHVTVRHVECDDTIIYEQRQSVIVQ